MATVRCPECRRALHLPDNCEIDTVACPLCRHTFAPPATVKIVPASLPLPSERVPSQLPDLASAHPPARLDEEDEDYPVGDSKEMAAALYSAGFSVRAMGVIGLLQAVPLCFLTILLLQRGVSLSDSASLVAYASGSILIHGFLTFAAGSLLHLSRFGIAVATVTVALGTSSLLILLSLPTLLQFLGVDTVPNPIFEEPCCGFCLFWPNLLVIACGLVGGTKGARALSRPGARELFDSSTPGD